MSAFKSVNPDMGGEHIVTNMLPSPLLLLMLLLLQGLLQVMWLQGAGQQRQPPLYESG